MGADFCLCKPLPIDYNDGPYDEIVLYTEDFPYEIKPFAKETIVEETINYLSIFEDFKPNDRAQCVQSTWTDGCLVLTYNNNYTVRLSRDDLKPYIKQSRNWTIKVKILDHLRLCYTSLTFKSEFNPCNNKDVIPGSPIVLYPKQIAHFVKYLKDPFDFLRFLKNFKLYKAQDQSVFVMRSVG